MDEEVYGAAGGGNGDGGAEGDRCDERARKSDADPASGEATCRDWPFMDPAHRHNKRPLGACRPLSDVRTDRC